MKEKNNNKEQKKKYQWVKSEKIGEIEIVVSEDNEKIYFESGNEIYKHVLNEFMLPIYGNENYIDKNIIEKKVDLSNPNINLQKQLPQYQQPQQNQVVLSKDVDAILTTLKKSANGNEVSTDITIKLNGLPTTNAIKLLSSIYDKEDFDKALELFLKDSNDLIISQLAKNLTCIK